MQSYNTLLSFDQEHLSVQQPGSTAGNVSGMWLTILNHYFPITQDYAHRPEEYQASMGGYTDITSVRWLGNTISDCRPFLITQTKARMYDTGAAEWQTGRYQLRGYLGGIRQGRRRKWYWGIVAIGSSVEFYTYNRNNDTLTMMGHRLHVVNNHQAIHNTLEGIRRAAR
ncbi:hypothetical protein M747DRAFT_304870 [Aspergillus niger ATCC 13496]|uniref:Uncharacterized protein n=1 Tax=Aspergillus niger ATCC 13496 TaxID=1353008 RepID=A0A370C411_ASPNG|nr:hypothetical protein M747DRAFT_304870 [Aspergillus niger ATCC 13496]